MKTSVQTFYIEEVDKIHTSVTSNGTMNMSNRIFTEDRQDFFSQP